MLTIPIDEETRNGVFARRSETFYLLEPSHASYFSALKILSGPHSEVREAGQIRQLPSFRVLANDITGPLAIKSFRAMGCQGVRQGSRLR